MQSSTMPAKSILRAVFMLMLTVPFAAQAALLGTKPGEWKNTVTVSVTVPGQGHKSMTQTKQECHKPSESMKAILGSLRKIHGCKVKVLHQTASLLDFRQDCTSPDGKQSMHIRMKMQALSSTHMAITMNQSYSTGAKSQLKGDAHWVSATCAQAKP